MANKSSTKLILLVMLFITATFIFLSAIFYFGVIPAKMKGFSYPIFAVVNLDDHIVVNIKKDVFDKIENEIRVSTNKGLEEGLCLYGEEGKILLIKDPITVYQSPEEIIFSCDKTYQNLNHIGTWHTHISGRCDLSRTDLFSFGKSDLRYSAISTKNELCFFRSDNIDRKIRWEIIY